ncbi:MAG: nitroreductase family protein [Bacteroidales bacterium]|nr:nitroreductase family protein [Bacteroidales bacterium]MBO6238552.1 nitroreductase family protein [Bacteroidales bacterium]
MADNYLEKKEQALTERRPVIRRTNVSLDTLLKRNRSYRGYDPSRKVSRDELERIVSVNPWLASGMNRQALRFKLVTEEDAGKVLPHIHLGAALPELHLPLPGTEPRAFIVICSAVPENPVLDIDLGISAQSMLLKAVEAGLNGIIILNFDRQAVRTALQLEIPPLAVIALGKGAEHIFLKPVSIGEDLAYYRKDGVHYVPKIRIDDLIL